MDSIERQTMAKVSWRLVPFLMFCYFIAYLDRVNIGFAGASMSKDLGLSAAAFGGAAGIFFIAYFFFEVPSNLALERFGARRWIARIMFTWGIITGAQAFVGGETSLNIVRLLLGIAEAGFFPGIIFYLTLWFPSAYRARICGLFMFAIPISTVIGAPISGLLLNLDGMGGLHGWQWMFIIEALPALLLTFGVLYYLTDRPADANWLNAQEKAWLQRRLDEERASRESAHHMSWKQSLTNPRVIGFGLLYMAAVIPQYGLSFFLPQIVKAFGGLGHMEVGLITALPYAVGAIGMVVWSRHSDATGERKWHTAIPLITIVVGLLMAAMLPSPAMKMAALCVAGFGFFAVLPIFWTLPTAYLSGAAAAAGIAAINSIGNLGGYFGPKVFGILKDQTGTDFASLIFLAGCAVIGVVLVMVLGRTPAPGPVPVPVSAH
ncbi:MFS transporter [Variovorax sp. J22R133]|uniref:MFS transporter n=1 Tax=Variovorax brevis TaxID=3053503 RepID=UPI002577F75E|nr:MFS transporter [Variovorax sp. J22R133]MDM0112558.1 MFS transporter [Variovorax sp. J22R133]